MMKRTAYLLALIAFSSFGYGQGKGILREKDGVKVLTYDYRNFEPLLHQNDDSVYVVNFWATWCAPCVRELPYFEKLNSAYKHKKVKVILVSLDMNKQVETSLLPFIKRKKLQTEVIHLHDPDADSWISKVDASWSGALPATVIYTKSQRKFYEQSFTYEQLEAEVKQLLIN